MLVHWRGTLALSQGVSLAFRPATISGLAAATSGVIAAASLAASEGSALLASHNFQALSRIAKLAPARQ